LSVVACNTLLTQHTEAATAVAFILLGAGIYLVFLRAKPQAA
jgi:hypothetical protein